jgi:hypothetical protein
MTPAEMHPVLQMLHDLPLGTIIRNSSWLYTYFLCLHFLGFSLLFGGLMVVDLRVLGFAKRIPLDKCLAFLPWVIIGFCINAFTGLCFFCFQPFQLWANWAFKIKMILVALAGLNALFFTLVEDKKLHAYAAEGKSPDLGMKISAFASLTIWVLVIVAGRLIVAFQGSSSLFGGSTDG